MLVEILSHDVNTYMAEIKFTHNDVVVQDKFNLLLVEPTMKQTLYLLGEEFTPEHQQTVIDNLTAWMQRNIERGAYQEIDK